VGKDDVAFGAVAGSVDHDLDGVASPHGNVAGGVSKMRQWRHAIRFVSDIDENIRAGDFEYAAFENLVPRRRGKMAVVLKKVLILLGIYPIDRHIQLPGHAVV
jgi:hypothetical protein